MSRSFRVQEGRTLTLPLDLAPGPGATRQRFAPGDVFTVEDERAKRNARFLNGRVAAGDIAPTDSAPSSEVTQPATPSAKAKRGLAIHTEK